MGPLELCELIRESVARTHDALPLFRPGARPASPLMLRRYNYAAVEALWHALGAERTMWRLGAIEWSGSFYYYLRRRGSSYVLDPTEGAFGTALDFNRGQPARFVAREPGRQAIGILLRAELVDVEATLDLPCGVCNASGRMAAGRLVCPWCGGSTFEDIPK